MNREKIGISLEEEEREFRCRKCGELGHAGKIRNMIYFGLVFDTIDWLIK